MRILNQLSNFSGIVSKVYIPITLRKPIYSVFAYMYGLNLGEVEYDLSFYKSFAEFFTRNLKAGLRPIEGKFVSPADSLLIDAGQVESQKLIGIKGCSYSVSDLFGGDNCVGNFSLGSFFNFYLAPGDYHHVHSPVSGLIVKRIYIPGNLYPVSKLFVRFFSDLYARQERVITLIKDTEDKYWAVVMVGAFNVGSMGLSYEPEFLTNDDGFGGEMNVREYPDGKEINVGDRLGTFNLGSTVVVVTETKFNLKKLSIPIGTFTRYGKLIQKL